MISEKNTFIAIDLKSFYASVECKDKELDSLSTNLVVADRSRTEKTICLAVSPSLKKWGIPGRARLFEVEQILKEVNRERQKNAPGGKFIGESFDDNELSLHPELKISYIAAVPRMARYMEVSTSIYKIYLKYIAPEDIHVYSIDEVFMDVTKYLNTYGLTPKELARKMILDIQENTGIAATAGIGTNMYLCKVAMDVMAKHVPADEFGVRIAELDEMSYRQNLWDHKPITDFWRVGRGYAKKLSSFGIYTMGDVARCSVGSEHDFLNEDLLYKAFGINAELLIDHAWGYEPCTMEMVKAYKPENNSISQGQVLQSAYDYKKARIIVREMADALSMQLLSEHKVTDQIVLTVGYDIESLTNPDIRNKYKGEVTTDFYGRKVPKHAHGTSNIEEFTSITSKIIDAALEIFDREVNPDLLVRRVTIIAGHVLDETDAIKKSEESFEQLSLFENYSEKEKSRENQRKKDEKERALQEATLKIQKKFGKNAILKGTSLEDGATAKERNNQIGGHKA